MAPQKKTEKQKMPWNLIIIILIIIIRITNSSRLKGLKKKQSEHHFQIVSSVSCQSNAFAFCCCMAGQTVPVAVINHQSGLEKESNEHRSPWLLDGFFFCTCFITHTNTIYYCNLICRNFHATCILQCCEIFTSKRNPMPTRMIKGP